MFPENDTEFEETTIAEVDASSEGWGIKRADGWSFFVPKESPIVPTIGMKARFYGRGIGSPVRGLFLDGVKVFYRNDAEQDEHFQLELYGADAAEWLKRWDAGRIVWSIEMGGLGPAYEQCIQITVAEILRHMLGANYDHTKWEGDDTGWKKDLELIREWSHKDPIIKKLGLSGAQWGAAVNLAAQLYRRGPRAVMKDDRVKDRQIQVSKEFPNPYE